MHRNEFCRMSNNFVPAEPAEAMIIGFTGENATESSQEPCLIPSKTGAKYTRT